MMVVIIFEFSRMLNWWQSRRSCPYNRDNVKMETLLVYLDKNIGDNVVSGALTYVLDYKGILLGYKGTMMCFDNKKYLKQNQNSPVKGR